MYVHIEEGLAGVPWFRVSDRLTMTADWRCLLNRAVNAMVELHCAIREVPAWVGNVSIRAELTHQACLAESRGISLSTRALRCIDEWAGVFGEAESQSGIWQHGDFSLNNLLVSADSLAVIDFDEFGSTLMPLHDAFGLALSFVLSQKGRCPLSRVDCIRSCVELPLRKGDILPEHLPGLLMHHLLWRINQCDGLERRSGLRRVLLRWVEDLATAPQTFLGNLA